MGFPHLTAPLHTHSLNLANRLVLPAMGTNQAESGLASAGHLAYYERRARAGVGLIIVEPTYVELRGRHRLRQLGIDEDHCIGPLKRIAEACHAHGSKVALQLFHAGGLVSAEVVGTQPEPVAPSVYACPDASAVARPLTEAEVEELPAIFAKAAVRAMAAGFDAVELHGAHGYLLAEFLSPHANRREDRYGGSLEGRMRLPLTVLAAVRAAVGPDFPILYRFSADEFLEDGVGLEESKRFARALEACGTDILDVSAGNSETMAGKQQVVPGKRLLPGVLVPLARAVKAVVSVPVITVGRINTPELAEAVLSTGAADLVAVARGLLADPDWIPKIVAGRPEEIEVCCAAMGCLQLLVKGEPVACTYTQGLHRLPPERKAEINRMHRSEALAAAERFGAAAVAAIPGTEGRESDGAG